MDGDAVGAGLGEGLEIGIHRRDHQVGVESIRRVRPHAPDEIRAEGDVRHEMAVHHVEMDPVGAGRVDGADLLAQPGEVGGQDRGGDDKRTRDEKSETCMFPEIYAGLERASPNMGRGRGQCAASADPVAERGQGKFCREAARLPGDLRALCRNPIFHRIAMVARRLLG